MTDDGLAVFIAARYDEAEAAATPGRDDLDDLRFELKRGDPYEQHLSSRIEDGLDSQTGVWHEFVLRDIALKRAILALHQPDGNPADEWYGSSVGCTSCGGYTIVAGLGDRGYQTRWPCPTVRQLGTEFSGHADYRPEWAPEA